MLDHFEQTRIGAEKILAEVGAAFDEILLILPVADLAHATDQQAIAIAADNAVPITAPDHLDDIPSGAAEDGFQFLNDFSIAANRAVQTLQVAVHDEDEIVQLFARGQGDGAESFRLVHLAVAHESPYFPAARLLQAAVFQIADKAGLVDGLDGAQPHGDGGEFPEIRHKPGMRIGAQPATGLQFPPEVLQLLFGDSSFQISPRVDSGSGMALEINNVAVAVLGAGAQEVVERHFV